ncbi:hypothetical protein LG314_10435 [Agrococcus terreus]|uniref:hypothetical protein n=1 Tax=Agrococcus terreus TaxID=574649 RepID=UPI00384F9B92
MAETRAQPVFARESALAVHGLPFGPEPTAVHTIGGSATARRKAGVVHATAEVDAMDVELVDGLLVCGAAYALADVARRREPVVAVAAIDAALRAGLVERGAVLEALGRQSARGRARAAWAIGFADERSESVGESWSRVRIHELGFPPPALQQWVAGASGRRHRPDMRWDLPELSRPLLGEFDGAVKYGALAQQRGETGAAALADEKRREDDLRVANAVARWVWRDVLEPARLERVLLAHGLPRLRPARWR